VGFFYLGILTKKKEKNKDAKSFKILWILRQNIEKNIAGDNKALFYFT